MPPIVNLIFSLMLMAVPQSDDLSGIIAAQRQQDFVGIWVRECRRADSTLTFVRQIWHRHPDQARIEFIAPEKLRNSALFIHGESVRFVGNRHLRHFARIGRGEAPMFIELLRNAAELDWIRANYLIETSRGDTLLGRPTEHLRLVPRNPHRGRLEIWPDRETGILLRTQRYDRHDNLISTSYFREIQFTRVDSTTVALPDSLNVAEPNRVDVDNFSDLGTFIANTSEALLLPRKLPAGFHFLQVKAIHRHGKKYYHLQYSDGLTMLSFFQHPETKAHTFREQKFGKDHRDDDATLSLLQGEKDEIAYSLMGEVAPEELQTMAASFVVVRKDQSAAALTPLWIGSIIVGMGVVLAFGFLRKRRRRLVNGND